MLEWHVEVGEHFAVRHQRDDVIDVRIGIDVMQPHPDAELAERAGEIDEFGPNFLALPFARGVFHVDAVGRCILGNDQEFLDPGGAQPLGLAKHLRGRPGD